MLGENRRQMAEADKDWGRRVLLGVRPQFAFALLLAVAEFVIGAASAANTAANEQQMLDKLTSIQSGISAIQTTLADIEVKIDDIIELLEELLPEIQNIVDASNYKSLVQQYVGHCTTARQTIQSYMPPSNPPTAAQHTTELLGALKTLQDAINVVISAGGGTQPGLDVATTIVPPFSVWLNTWDMVQAIIAANTTGYTVVHARNHALFTDMRTWIDAFFKQCADARDLATDNIATLVCPLQTDSPADTYAFNGTSFVRVNGILPDEFRWDSFEIECPLRMSQYSASAPNHVVWKAAALLTTPGIPKPNPALGNAAALGLSAYKACLYTQAKLVSAHNTLDTLGDVDTTYAKVTSALDLI
jgi:hypothetical protein